MITINKQIIKDRVSCIQHGFKEMMLAAEEIVATITPSDSYAFAQELFASDTYQVRMVAVFIMGDIAREIKEPLTYLQQTVSFDSSWQVQEILAKAFDQYCHDAGYEQALPDIQHWLADENPNVKRAVTEGLRIWNQRPYFKQHPDVAIALLSQWKDHESEYLRKSVGNALRDISKSEKSLIQQEVAGWDLSSQKIKLTYKLASKFLA